MVREEDLAVLMSLHELDLARRVSDTVVCVAGDHIDRVGPPEEIFTRDYIAKLYHMEPGRYDPASPRWISYRRRQAMGIAAPQTNRDFAEKILLSRVGPGDGRRCRRSEALRCHCRAASGRACAGIARAAVERSCRWTSTGTTLRPRMPWKALDAGDALVNLGDVSLYATAYYILDLIRADGYVAVMLPGVTSICAVALFVSDATDLDGGAGAHSPPAAPIWLTRCACRERRYS